MSARERCGEKCFPYHDDIGVDFDNSFLVGSDAQKRRESKAQVTGDADFSVLEIFSNNCEVGLDECNDLRGNCNLCWIISRDSSGHMF